MWPTAMLRRQSSYIFIIVFSKYRSTMPIGLFCWVSVFRYCVIALVCHGEETFLCSYRHVSELLGKARLPFNKQCHPTGISTPPLF